MMHDKNSGFVVFIVNATKWVKEVKTNLFSGRQVYKEKEKGVHKVINDIKLHKLIL